MDLTKFIRQAREHHCSDLHLTAGTAIAVRQYGVLKLFKEIPSLQETEDAILSLLSDERDTEYVKAGNDLDVACTDADGNRMRANIYHQRNNLAASIRLLESDIPTFDELGMPRVLEDLANRRSGLVIVTGVTGSGKSTTLASMLDYINKNQSKHIITIEDPIEYVYKYQKAMIHQRQVGKDVKDFATALRSSLREDPDIIMVGEMRDYETIHAAVTAAETGHLVLSTLHTRSAAQTVERIISSSPLDAQVSLTIQLATNLAGVITQELVPLMDGSGRIAATEIMINNPAINNLIRENKVNQIQSVLQSGAAHGMHTLNSSLVNLVRRGKISRDEALVHSNAPGELKSLI